MEIGFKSSKIFVNVVFLIWFLFWENYLILSKYNILILSSVTLIVNLFSWTHYLCERGEYNIIILSEYWKIIRLLEHGH